VHFDVLGPLRVTGSAGRVPVPSGRSSAALAWLVANANEWLSINGLVSLLWRDPPATAAAKTRLLVRSLEPLLEPGTLEFSDRVRLIVPGQAVDAWRFEELVTEARKHLVTGHAAGDARRARVNLREALALWRGDPYPELDRALPAQAVIERLHELRVTAIEELNELALAEADYALVAELRSQVILFPDRSRLRRQLALALYRTDRQVEALDVLRELRRELGDDDGRSAALQAAFLRHDRQIVTA
jgi:DNA-binding SARP family transcriptional activator